MGGVYYVPAGVESYSQLSRVFYEKPEHNEQEYSENTITKKQIHLHNRMIQFTTSKYGNTPDISEDFNKTVSCIGPAFLKDIGIKICLVNHNAKPINYNPMKDCGIYSILDSGGFQLRNGVKKFIDPVKIVKEYNEFANLGMDLDFPMYFISDDDYDTFRTIALIQKANYEVMKELLHPKVHIALVNHGLTVEERTYFYDVLDRWDSEYISLAGFARQNITPYSELYIAEAIAHTCYLFNNIKYLHCLGATSNTAFIVYALFYHLGLVNAIGSDSVTHMYNGITGDFAIIPKKDIHIPNSNFVHFRLPCNCPICSLLNDTRLINFNLPVTSHTLYTRKYRVDMIVNLTKDYLDGNISAKDYLNLTASKIGEVRLRNLVNYVKEFKASGEFKKAQYPVRDNSSPLFNSNEDGDDVFEYWLSVVRRYEKYHQKRFY